MEPLPHGLVPHPFRCSMSNVCKIETFFVVVGLTAGETL